MATRMENLQRRSKSRPPRFMLYGVAGLGKTTLGTHAPAPVFLQTEDSEVDVPTFGLLKTFGELTEAISALHSEDHAFRSVVLDSLDWLEPMVWAETARLNGWKDIEGPGFGKGFMAALDQWRLLLDGFDALRNDRDMTVIMIAHCEIKRFDSPETDSYDRYQPKLHARASALVQEHCDAVLFANYRVSTVKTDLGFNKKAVRGVSSGDRLLYTNERPAFLAKNRFNLPDSMPLEWSALEQAIPYYNQAASPAAAE